MGRCKDCVVGILGACGGDYCLTERELLIDQARKLAEQRGHSLLDFVKEKRRPIWQAACVHCGQLARINLDPTANETDIYGVAITADCMK